MRKYSKEQIREIAADVFGRYPKAMNVAVTEDGQAFITDESDAAVRNHAREKRYKGALEIYSFKRKEFETEKLTKKQKAEKNARTGEKSEEDTGRKKENAREDGKAENAGKQTTGVAGNGQTELKPETGQKEDRESSKSEEL